MKIKQPVVKSDKNLCYIYKADMIQAIGNSLLWVYQTS